ncbi:Glyoxalase-like domain-containing protein [Aphelenchoides besseyi]|nr:Glyoxalase-like domain-containing protein [Aphelenchoides besseyi]
MTIPTSPRALHYVFRVGNRQKSYEFFTKTLQMKVDLRIKLVLRHEEFEEGCSATCNGPYAGKWSKTMIGYGHEIEHFVLELTYNYGVGSYELGNDYEAIHIESDEVYHSLKDKAEKGPETSLLVRDPDGHKFYVYPGKTDLPVRRVSCNVKSLSESKTFWQEHLGMKEIHTSDKSSVLTYGKDQCSLELIQLDSTMNLNRGTAYGRIAFTYSTNDLKDFQERIRKVNPHFIQTEHTKLDTPGKASVHVVIMRDPNDHEICFVSEEFWSLAQFDPEAEKLIKEAIEKDDSNEYYEKRGKEKPAAK